MPQAAAAPQPPDSFASFHISEGGDITIPGHRLYDFAKEIRQHAFNTEKKPHKDRRQGCVGVADVVNRLVNDLLISNAPLAREGRRLATLIGGPQAEAQAQAFRDAAHAYHSVTWSIDKRNVTLTIPIGAADRTPFDQQDAPSPLRLDSNNLVLTLPYQEGHFFSPDQHPSTFLVGDLCQMAIGQVRHAIKHAQQSHRSAPANLDTLDGDATTESYPYPSCTGSTSSSGDDDDEMTGSSSHSRGDDLSSIGPLTTPGPTRRDPAGESRSRARSPSDDEGGGGGQRSRSNPNGKAAAARSSTQEGLSADGINIGSGGARERRDLDNERLPTEDELRRKLAQAQESNNQSEIARLKLLLEQYATELRKEQERYQAMNDCTLREMTKIETAIEESEALLAKTRKNQS